MKLEKKQSRGRPREFDRDRALDLAQMLFWQNGYEGTSIAELTSVLGITPPSLYAAFGSKDALYREVLALYLSTRSERMTKALEKKGSARAAIDAMLKEAVDMFTSDDSPRGCLVANGALRCAKEHQPIAEHTAMLRRLTQDGIKRRLDRAKEEGDLPKGTDTAALASFYASVIQGISVQAVDGASKARLRDIVRFAMAAWPS